MTESDVRLLIGQVLVAGFDGPAVNEHATRLIAHHKVQNIIFFARNLRSTEQTRTLTRDLQRLAKTSGLAHPLIICTDQENGTVRRLAKDVPGLPGNMAMGAVGDADLVRKVGAMTARQLRALGINMNLAPVLDVNNNPDNPVVGVRSYGEDPQAVATLGTAMMQGLQEEGLIACVKHFPGHGDTAVDSHIGLPSVPHTLERLEQIELAPFRRAIQAGVDVVMTAHVSFPAVEPDAVPATLSRRVLTGLLRERLGFTGVVTTDCLEMNAISEGIGVGQGAVRALAAGADLVMVSHRLDRQEETIETIVNAVAAGELPLSRLQEAAERVAKLRTQRIGAWVDFADDGSRFAPYSIEDLQAEALQLQKQACSQAVTVVADDHVLPMRPEAIRQIFILESSLAPVNMAAGPNAAPTALLDAVGRLYTEAKTTAVMFREEDSIDKVLNEVSRADLVLVVLAGSKASHWRALMSSLAEAQVQVVYLAVSTPYELANLTAPKAALALYENTPWMLEAAVRTVALGTGQGSLPVTVSREWGCGHRANR